MTSVQSFVIKEHDDSFHGRCSAGASTKANGGSLLDTVEAGGVGVFLSIWMLKGLLRLSGKESDSCSR